VSQRLIGFGYNQSVRPYQSECVKGLICNEGLVT